jgi:hypothetical protein
MQNQLMGIFPFEIWVTLLARFSFFVFSIPGLPA